jgi:hypothetical protein
MRLGLSGRAIARSTSVRVWKALYKNEIRPSNFLNYQLGDSITSAYLEWFHGGVVQGYFNLSAIACIDSARRIQNRYAVIQG